MSLNARYILKYDCQPYLSPTPMEDDKKFLGDKYGGEFIDIGWEYDLLWDKPKYTLPEEDIKRLKADQILEYLDGGIWEDITNKKYDN